MTVQGVMKHAGYRSEWEVLMAEHNGNRWYGGDDAKKACKRLVEGCSDVGGANHRKLQGTSLHAITAMLDTGKTPTFLSPKRNVTSTPTNRGLAEAGITFVAGSVEMMVVLDRWHVAGTADRLALVPGFPLPFVADLKTGASIKYAERSIAVQLAAYSRRTPCTCRDQQRTAAKTNDARCPPSISTTLSCSGSTSAAASSKSPLSTSTPDGKRSRRRCGHRQWRNRKLAIDLSELRKDADRQRPGTTPAATACRPHGPAARLRSNG